MKCPSLSNYLHTVFVEKMTVTQPVNKWYAFVQLEVLLPRSQFFV
jgi:hypothetical protein